MDEVEQKDAEIRSLRVAIAKTMQYQRERDEAQAEVNRLRAAASLAIELLEAAHHGEAPLCDHLPWGRTGGLCVCGYLREVAG